MKFMVGETGETLTKTYPDSVSSIYGIILYMGGSPGDVREEPVT